MATHTCFFFFGFFLSLFPSIFCTISAFSLYGEYVVRSFLPDGLLYFVFCIFQPCDHGLDFLHQLIMWEFNQLVNQPIKHVM